VIRQQLYLLSRLYLVILAVVAVFTRATPRRIVGASVGAALAGAALLGIVAIGENAGWWHMAITWEPRFITLMWIDTVPCGFIFLITWRVARRFGGRGLAVVAVVAAVLGPVRDYRYMAGNLPGVGRLCARACTRVCNFCGVCPLGGIGPRNDAAGRWPCRGRPAGAPTLGIILMLRLLKVGSRTTFRR
jgi:hypothetical protein